MKKQFDFATKYFLRDIVGGYMKNLGIANSSVVVVNADLAGTCRNKTFVETYPERSFNVGIAEQNMVSFAAGLAHEGFMPYVFTMAPFMSMRACEQCRTDVAYAGLNVRMIGTYAGVSGGISGATHWGLEDAVIMGSMQGMTVLEPCDPVQAQMMLDATLDYVGPIYMRITCEPTIALYDADYDYEIGKASIVKDGNDGAFICAGITVKYALIAALEVEQETGRSIRVVDMHTLKPIDIAAVLAAGETGNVVVAQDHVKYGGLGNQVAEIFAENKVVTNFRNIAIDDKFVAMAHAPYLYQKYGLDDKGLKLAMLELLNKE